MNEDINFPEVRCSSDDGTQHGIISSDEALDLAYKAGKDLVLIADSARPPVVKIMDYGKFKYEKEKKIKEAKKRQKKIVLKEVKFSVKIAQNDINFKVKHAREFIEAGYHVKLRVFLRGREMANPSAGKEVLETKVWPLLEDIAKRERPASQEGRFINMMIFPQKV